MTHSREQQLIDLMFELTIRCPDYYGSDDKEKIAGWVAYQLKQAGFETVPMGLSWGILQ